MAIVGVRWPPKASEPGTQPFNSRGKGRERERKSETERKREYVREKREKEGVCAHRQHRGLFSFKRELCERECVREGGRENTGFISRVMLGPKIWHPPLAVFCQSAAETSTKSSSARIMLLVNVTGSSHTGYACMGLVPRGTHRWWFSARVWQPPC